MSLTAMKGMMGLCVRAGQAAFGEGACLTDIRKGNCGLLLLDGEISSRSEKKYLEACAGAGIMAAKLPAGFLEGATGRSGMAMAVRKGSFAERIKIAAEAAEEIVIITA